MQCLAPQSQALPLCTLLPMLVGQHAAALLVTP